MAKLFRKPRNVLEYQSLAETLIPVPYYQYYDHPGPSGQTYTDSIEAFKRYRFRPRVLTDVSDRRLSTSLLGQPVDIPIGLAPCALQRYAHKDAEKATAKGAEAAGALMIQSVFSTESVAKVAEAAPDGIRWMQTYIWKDRRITEYTIRQAEAAGYKAIVVTVDSPWPNMGTAKHGYAFRRNTELYDREDLRKPNLEAGTDGQEEAKKNGDPHLSYYWKIQFDPSVTWKDIAWVKTITSLPVVCKGILTDRAAVQAADAGADGILVSAHGGRQLDGVPAPIDALSEVVEAVRGRNVEVYMDGGVRTGSDVLKALARGARAVFVGRPAIWGLACHGTDGVQHVLSILREELESALGLLGCSDVNDIPSDTVVHQSFYNISQR